MRFESHGRVKDFQNFFSTCSVPALKIIYSAILKVQNKSHYIDILWPDSHTMALQQHQKKALDSMAFFCESPYHNPSSKTLIMFIFLVSSVSGQNKVTNYIRTIKQEASAKYLCQTSSSPKLEKPFNNYKQSQA